MSSLEIFSPSLLDVSSLCCFLWGQKLLSLIQAHFVYFCFCCLHFRSYSRSCHLLHCLKVFSLFSCNNFIVLGLKFSFSIQLSFVSGNRQEPNFILYPILPLPFIEKTILSLMLFSGLGTFVKNQLTVFMGIKFWSLYYVSVVYVPVFMPVACCFYYYSFVVCFEVRHCDVCNLIFSPQFLCLFWDFCKIPSEFLRFFL